VAPLLEYAAMSPTFFENEIRLLDRYYWQCRSRSSPWDEQVVKELRERLRQLSYLYDEIVPLEAAVLAAHAHRWPGRVPDVCVIGFMPLSDLPNPDAGTWSVPAFGDSDRLRLNVETFYFVAHRMMVLSEQRKALPRLAAIEAVGVRRVRNSLIEHAHEKDGNPAQTFSVSNASGTRLRPAARAEDPQGYQDQGIHHNAGEFRGAVRACLEAALREAPREEPGS
jgi:hypothetical protein